MREVTFRIRHRGGPESEVSARHPEVTFQSVSSMTGSSSEWKRIIELRGPTESIESFLAEFKQADAVIEATPISSVAGGHTYVAVTFDTTSWDGIGERLSNLGVHYRMGTTITGGIEQWTVYIDADDDLSAVVRTLEREGNEVELARNVELDSLERSAGLPSVDILQGVTERQREVLATAIAIGYYDHGSGVGIEDVATELSLGSTTVWEHLSRAESTVMNALFERFEAWERAQVTEKQ